MVRPTMALLALFALSAASAGCGADNVASCLRYVEARNEAYTACNMRDQVVDPDATCPPTLNEGPDCSDYYDNLAESFECTAGEVTWDDTGSCA